MHKIRGKQYTLLVKEAVNALERAYIPDPAGWRFGSAVMRKKGSIYSSGHDIDVVMANRKGEYTVKKISELISFPWPPEEYYQRNT